MSTNAEELLKGLSEGEMATYSMNPEDEPHIVVNSDRTITVPDSLKCIGVYRDHNIETVTFDCPRYWDGHDLSEMNIYINSRCATKGVGRTPNSYLVNDVSIDESDSNTIHFTWTISEYVTSVEEKIDFIVCAVDTDADGVEIRRWHSHVCQDMYICEGFDAVHEIVQAHPDIIEQMLVRIDEVEALVKELEQHGVSAEQIAGAVENYFKENGVGGATDEQIAQIEQNADDIEKLQKDVSDIKENGSGADGFSPIVTVTQTPTGATISVTDVNGTTTAEIHHGENSESGSVSEEQIASAVRAYLEENPIESVTEEELEQAIDKYLDENPVESVTSEWVEQAVEKYLKIAVGEKATCQVASWISGTSNSVTVYYSDTIDVIDGEIVLVNRKGATFYKKGSSNYSKNDYECVKGKYAQAVSGDVYLIEETSSYVHEITSGSLSIERIVYDDACKIITREAIQNEQIASTVENYLDELGVSTEQIAQIEQNKNDIEEIKKEIGDVELLLSGL